MNFSEKVIYEVDLRDRKTGNSVETIYSGENVDKAYETADEWNKNHGFGILGKTTIPTMSFYLQIHQIPIRNKDFLLMSTMLKI